ncbi:hypothetical protein LXL04_026586 [Taraxacum kok-saghyz]
MWRREVERVPYIQDLTMESVRIQEALAAADSATAAKSGVVPNFMKPGPRGSPNKIKEKNPTPSIIVNVAIPVAVEKSRLRTESSNTHSNGRLFFISVTGRLKLDDYNFVRHGDAIPHVIDAEIAVGQHAGKIVFLPRIPLSPSDDDMFPFKLRRKQFPVRLCFAMTINKAQGQTIPNVGVYLPEPVFSHVENNLPPPYVVNVVIDFFNFDQIDQIEILAGIVGHYPVNILHIDKFKLGQRHRGIRMEMNREEDDLYDSDFEQIDLG